MSDLRLEGDIRQEGPCLFSYAGVVVGYLHRLGGELSCPAILSLEPGKGHGKACIEALEQLADAHHLQLVFPAVYSDVLRRILANRGYRYTERFVPEFDETIEVWERTANAESISCTRPG